MIIAMLIIIFIEASRIVHRPQLRIACKLAAGVCNAQAFVDPLADPVRFPGTG